MATRNGGSMDSCTRAAMASAEVLAEECSGEPMEVAEISEGVLALVPQDARSEMGVSMDPDDMASAVEDCIDSEWATDWAESVLGADAGEGAMEQAKRRACEGLFD